MFFVPAETNFLVSDEQIVGLKLILCRLTFLAAVYE